MDGNSGEQVLAGEASAVQLPSFKDAMKAGMDELRSNFNLPPLSWSPVLEVFAKRLINSFAQKGHLDAKDLSVAKVRGNILQWSAAENLEPHLAAHHCCESFLAAALDDLTSASPCSTSIVEESTNIFAAAVHSRAGNTTIVLIFSGRTQPNKPGKEVRDMSNSVFRETILDYHNQVRAEVHVSPLRWAKDLEAQAKSYAQALANAGSQEHSAHNSRPDQGENVCFHACSTIQLVDAAMETCKVFENESQFYTPGSPLELFKAAIFGHYTQMVWQETTSMGAALAVGNNGIYVVCRYSPAGNWVGMAAYGATRKESLPPSLPTQSIELFRAAMIEGHNRARAKVGVGPLEWSLKLEHQAQAWVSTMTPKGYCLSSPAKSRWMQGETLFFTPEASLTPEDIGSLCCTTFNQEAAQYTSGSCITEENHYASNYTQMVWSKSMIFGAAFIAGPKGCGVVCRYFPQGNCIGEVPYDPAKASGNGAVKLIPTLLEQEELNRKRIAFEAALMEQANRQVACDTTDTRPARAEKRSHSKSAASSKAKDPHPLSPDALAVPPLDYSNLLSPPTSPPPQKSTSSASTPTRQEATLSPNAVRSPELVLSPKSGQSSLSQRSSSAQMLQFEESDPITPRKKVTFEESEATSSSFDFSALGAESTGHRYRDAFPSIEVREGQHAPKASDAAPSFAVVRQESREPIAEQPIANHADKDVPAKDHTAKGIEVKEMAADSGLAKTTAVKESVKNWMVTENATVKEVEPAVKSPTPMSRKDSFAKDTPSKDLWPQVHTAAGQPANETNKWPCVQRRDDILASLSPQQRKELTLVYSGPLSPTGKVPSNERAIDNSIDPQSVVVPRLQMDRLSPQPKKMEPIDSEDLSQSVVVPRLQMDRLTPRLRKTEETAVTDPMPRKKEPVVITDDAFPRSPRIRTSFASPDSPAPQQGRDSQSAYNAIATPRSPPLREADSDGSMAPRQRPQQASSDMIPPRSPRGRTPGDAPLSTRLPQQRDPDRGISDNNAPATARSRMVTSSTPRRESFPRKKGADDRGARYQRAPSPPHHPDSPFGGPVVPRSRVFRTEDSSNDATPRKKSFPFSKTEETWPQYRRGRSPPHVTPTTPAAPITPASQPKERQRDRSGSRGRKLQSEENSIDNATPQRQATRSPPGKRSTSPRTRSTLYDPTFVSQQRDSGSLTARSSSRGKTTSVEEPIGRDSNPRERVTSTVPEEPIPSSRRTAVPIPVQQQKELLSARGVPKRFNNPPGSGTSPRKKVGPLVLKSSRLQESRTSTPTSGPSAFQRYEPAFYGMDDTGSVSTRSYGRERSVLQPTEASFFDGSSVASTPSKTLRSISNNSRGRHDSTYTASEGGGSAISKSYSNGELSGAHPSSQSQSWKFDDTRSVHSAYSLNSSISMYGSVSARSSPISTPRVRSTVELHGSSTLVQLRSSSPGSEVSSMDWSAVSPRLHIALDDGPRTPTSHRLLTDGMLQGNQRPPSVAGYSQSHESRNSPLMTPVPLPVRPIAPETNSARWKPPKLDESLVTARDSCTPRVLSPQSPTPTSPPATSPLPGPIMPVTSPFSLPLIPDVPSASFDSSGDFSSDSGESLAKIKRHQYVSSCNSPAVEEDFGPAGRVCFRSHRMSPPKGRDSRARSPHGSPLPGTAKEVTVLSPSTSLGNTISSRTTPRTPTSLRQSGNWSRSTTPTSKSPDKDRSGLVSNRAQGVIRGSSPTRSNASSPYVSFSPVGKFSPENAPNSTISSALAAKGLRRNYSFNNRREGAEVTPSPRIHMFSNGDWESNSRGSKPTSAVTDTKLMQLKSGAVSGGWSAPDSALLKRRSNSLGMAPLQLGSTLPTDSPSPASQMLSRMMRDK